MIPVRDVIPSRRAPVGTLALVVVSATLHVTGLLETPTVSAWMAPGAGGFSPARALLALFRYESWLALAVGLLCLWLFGENVEDRLGTARFLVLFAAAGVASAAVAEAGARTGLARTSPSAGVLGAYLVLFPSSRMLLLAPRGTSLDLIEAPATYLMLAWLVAQVALSWRTPEIAVLTSLAGAAAGAGLVVLLGGRGRRTRYWTDGA